MGSRTLSQRLKDIFKQNESQHEYQPVETEYTGVYDDNDVRRPILDVPDDTASNDQPFSWLEYSVFLLLGIGMLWAWNMFLSAAPYFQSRFADSKAILASFQSAITSVSCVTNLVCTVVLTQFQSKANYPKRIRISLVMFFIVFSLLTISTSHFYSMSTQLYFVFTLIMVFITSLGTGLCQNGAFAFAAGIGRPEYIQAIVAGQGIAGVLPAIAQIISVLSVSEPEESATAAEKTIIISEGSASAAFTYFVTASVISIITFLAVIPLLRKYNQIQRQEIINSFTTVQGTSRPARKVVGMLTLYKKLNWLAASIFLCLAITMFFPVFTERIVSVIPEDEAPRILRRSSFIPLGFLCWNIGDLLGRLSIIGPISKWRVTPKFLFFLVCLRSLFIPIYFLCNIGGHGAVIKSDGFYLIVASVGFGMSNGFLTSLCLIRATSYVSVDEREAAGGFMVVNLLAGLMFGSLLSFAASGVGT